MMKLLPAFLCLAAALSADTVNYKYDDAGRLTSVSYADGTVIAYSYDNAGNLLARSVTPAPQQSASGAPKSKPAKRKDPAKKT